jgi:excisionase family DNA binding protein
MVGWGDIDVAGELAVMDMPMAPIPLADRLLLSEREAAGMLGISRAALLDLIIAGRLSYVRIGARRLLPRAILDAFIARCVEA